MVLRFPRLGLWFLVVATCSALVLACDQARLFDSDSDGDGVLNRDDSNDEDPHQCYDKDGDGCDDCTNGAPSQINDAKPNLEGTSDGDFDDDGLCDIGDIDDDNDTVDDSQDEAPLNPNKCHDLDHDTCDDCTYGSPNTLNDSVPNAAGTSDGDY